MTIFENLIDIIQALAIASLAFWVWSLNKRIDAFAKSYAKRIQAEKASLEAHQKAFLRLSDPDSIQEDMERSASAVELRNASRLTQPRPDAGPPAKIHRPPLRNAPRRTN